MACSHERGETRYGRVELINTALSSLWIAKHGQRERTKGIVPIPMRSRKVSFSRMGLYTALQRLRARETEPSRGRALPVPSGGRA